MPQYYDSDQDWPRIVQDADNAVVDISDYSLEAEYYQNGKLILTLSQDSGIEFDTDGSDGAFTISMTAEQSKLFCAGAVRVLIRNVADGARRLLWEGNDTVEGPGFDG